MTLNMSGPGTRTQTQTRVDVQTTVNLFKKGANKRVVDGSDSPGSLGCPSSCALGLVVQVSRTESGLWADRKKRLSNRYLK